uniref:TIR domain-containing protein n=1 Tax=Fagus sylvatica TaxID=28930 RepID=A0A2N9J3W9_FAGSY
MLRTQEASSSSTARWKYDVFVSFRREDARNGFTDRLYYALKFKGIVTFRDEEKLERGKSISPEILKAIEESRFAIVILSRNYASSTRCLDELVKIIEGKKEMERTIFPIFYDVNPSDVRKQTGTFAQAFAEYEDHFKDNTKKVQTWRSALREVSNLKGWHLQDGDEARIIEYIVRELSQKLSYAVSEVPKGLVGIISAAEKLESCLAIGSNDVRIIGVCGMGGMGKTTLARVVFQMVSKEFEGCCFLPNVMEVSRKDGLVPLQQQLILQLLNERMSIQDVQDGVFMIKNRLCHKRILLVLDDVDQLDHLEKLVGKHNWFGLGSRVIITTRDKHLLRSVKADEIYEVEGLNFDEALHLLSLKAFKKDHPPKDYLELSKDVVHYSNGLPLVIEILVQMLDYLGLYPDVGLRVLLDKSLIQMNDTRVWMLDILQGIGRNIVYEECPKEPGKRSRLWLFNDIKHVLTKNTGTEAIQVIVLKLPEPKEATEAIQAIGPDVFGGNEAYWNFEACPEAFSKMCNLRYLIINDVHIPNGLNYLSNELRYLEWRGYSSKCLPSSFQPKELVELKLRFSKIDLSLER